MSKNAAEGGAGSDGKNVEEPHVGRLIAFLFLTSFAGLLAIVPFRNSLIIRHRLTFPSGTASAHLINTVHTPQGAKQARCARSDRSINQSSEATETTCFS